MPGLLRIDHSTLYQCHLQFFFFTSLLLFFFLFSFCSHPFIPLSSFSFFRSFIPLLPSSSSSTLRKHPLYHPPHFTMSRRIEEKHSRYKNSPSPSTNANDSLSQLNTKFNSNKNSHHRVITPSFTLTVFCLFLLTTTSLSLHSLCHPPPAVHFCTPFSHNRERLMDREK